MQIRHVFLWLIVSVLLMSCVTVPTIDGADGAQVQKMRIDNEEREGEGNRNFDPCLINPSLSVCKK